jgi:hypothetical protein
VRAIDGDCRDSVALVVENVTVRHGDDSSF